MTSGTSAAPVRDEQLSINGLRIHAQIRGEGEPLLLYSGIWGEVGLWEQLLPHLGGFRTIAFDPPGIGRSQLPAFPLTMRGLARFGTAVLDELGIESAHVLGASFGGAVAQQMAFSLPQPGSPAGAGVDVLRRFRPARQPESFLALRPPAQLSSGTSRTRGRCHVRREAARPSRNSSARCTSGGRRIPWPPCTGWPRFSAGRACRGCGPSASPHWSSPATTTPSRRW